MDIKFNAMKICDCYFAHLKTVNDERGSFQKFFHEATFEEVMPGFKLGEAYLTSSSKNVLRGMHFQLPPNDHSKVVICLSGHVTDVLLDLRPGRNFGTFAAIDLVPDKNNIVIIPKGVAHGFYAHRDHSNLLYLVETIHSEDSDSGIHWDGFGYTWPTEHPIISERDRVHPNIKNFAIPKEWYFLKKQIKPQSE